MAFPRYHWPQWPPDAPSPLAHSDFPPSPHFPPSVSLDCNLMLEISTPHLQLPPSPTKPSIAEYPPFQRKTPSPPGPPLPLFPPSSTKRPSPHRNPPNATSSIALFKMSRVFSRASLAFSPPEDSTSTLSSSATPKSRTSHA